MKFALAIVTALTLSGCTNSEPKVSFLQSMNQSVSLETTAMADLSGSQSTVTSTNGLYKADLKIHSGNHRTKITSTNNLYTIELRKVPQ